MISLNVKDRCHNCPDFTPEARKDIRYGKDPDPIVEMQVSCTHRGLCDRLEAYIRKEGHYAKNENISRSSCASHGNKP